MALQSLRYDRGGDVQENRSGIKVYGGESSKFHEWEFHSSLRYNTAKEADKRQESIEKRNLDEFLQAFL